MLFNFIFLLISSIVINFAPQNDSCIDFTNELQRREIKIRVTNLL